MTGTPLHIGTFKQRPVVVRAVRVTIDNATPVAAWCGGGAIHPGSITFTRDGKVLYLDTPTGRVYAADGDYVVNDPATGFRVCDPGSFTSSHDEVCKVVHAWMHPMRDGAPSTCLTCGAINGDDQQAVTW